MKLIKTTKQKIHQSARFVQVAAVLTLASIPGLAESQPSCSVEGSDKADWVRVEKAAQDCVYVKPGVNWGKYARIQIEPSSFASVNEQEQMKEEDTWKLTAFFDAKLQLSFKDQAGSDGPVLRIKPMIMAVRRSKS